MSEIYPKTKYILEKRILIETMRYKRYKQRERNKRKSSEPDYLTFLEHFFKIRQKVFVAFSVQVLFSILA